MKLKAAPHFRPHRLRRILPLRPSAHGTSPCVRLHALGRAPHRRLVQLRRVRPPREIGHSWPALRSRDSENFRRNTEHICKDVLDRAIQAAEDAAAQVIKRPSKPPRRGGPGSLPETSSSYESVRPKSPYRFRAQAPACRPGEAQGLLRVLLQFWPQGAARQAVVRNRFRKRGSASHGGGHSSISGSHSAGTRKIDAHNRPTIL